MIPIEEKRVVNKNKHMEKERERGRGIIWWRREERTHEMVRGEVRGIGRWMIYGNRERGKGK